MPKTDKRFNAKELAGYLLLTACGLLGRLVVHYKAGWLMDSDQASELLLAFKLNEERSIVSRNWIYSTELRVFETQWIYRIGAFLFPDNWSRARLFSVLLMMLLTSLAAYYFARKAGFGAYAKLYAFLLMLPVGYSYFFYVILAPHYQPYLLFTYLTAGLVFAFMNRFREKGSPGLLIPAAGAALAVMSGCNGIRQMQVLYLPLLLAALLVLAMDARRTCGEIRDIPVRCRKSFAVFLFALALCVFNALGIFINHLLASVCEFLSFNDLHLMSGEEKTYGYLFWEYLKLFGYEGGQRLFSATGILSLLGLVMAFAVAFSAVRIAWKFKSRSFASQFLLVFFVSELAVNLTVFKFLDYYSSYHQLPAMPFGLALVILELKEERTSLKETRGLAAAALTGIMLLCSANAVMVHTAEPLLADRDREVLAEWMVDAGIEHAGASFWDSNVLTELSNGKIEMWTLEWGWGWNQDQEYLTPFHISQDKSHIDHFPEGKMYLIHNEQYSGSFEDCAVLEKGELIYRVGPYMLWEFSSSKDVFGDLVKED